MTLTESFNALGELRMSYWITTHSPTKVLRPVDMIYISRTAAVEVLHFIGIEARGAVFTKREVVECCENTGMKRFVAGFAAAVAAAAAESGEPE